MFFQQTPALVEMIGLKIGWHRLQAAHALPLEATMHCSICARRPWRRCRGQSHGRVHPGPSRQSMGVHTHGIFIKTPRLKGEASFTCFFDKPFFGGKFFSSPGLSDSWGQAPRITHLPCPPHHLGEPRHALWERSTVVRCLQIASE